MRLLLLQARVPGDPAALHELDAFSCVIGDHDGRLEAWDLLRGAPTLDDLRASDCVLVGGSGHFSVNGGSRHSWISDFIDTMGRLTTMDVPVFASCFGFQALIVACGGRIASDVTHSEFGTFEVTVSEAGLEDPYFKDLAPSFSAQFGHAEYAASLPSGFVNLASTERNEYQAARVRGKCIYLTQFHPELSMQANRERALMYTETYAEKGLVDPSSGFLPEFRESGAASGLLRRFVADVRAGVHVTDGGE
jgi:GMP synthase (glutamine-hydrolysing)